MPPFVFFIGLMLLFFFGLKTDPQYLPSPLINKPAPDFNLPNLHQPTASVSLTSLKGQVTLLNVWASWCTACLTEHAVLVKIANDHQFNLYGLNYKDKRNDAIQWLEKWGNPYIQSAFDQYGTVGVDYGIYGVPETFLLDKNGIIRYKHIGPLSEQQLETIIIPLVKEIETTSS